MQCAIPGRLSGAEMSLFYREINKNKMVGGPRALAAQLAWLYYNATF